MAWYPSTAGHAAPKCSGRRGSPSNGSTGASRCSSSRAGADSGRTGLPWSRDRVVRWTGPDRFAREVLRYRAAPTLPSRGAGVARACSTWNTLASVSVGEGRPSPDAARTGPERRHGTCRAPGGSSCAPPGVALPHACSPDSSRPVPRGTDGRRGVADPRGLVRRPTRRGRDALSGPMRRPTARPAARAVQDRRRSARTSTWDARARPRPQSGTYDTVRRPDRSGTALGRRLPAFHVKRDADPGAPMTAFRTMGAARAVRGFAPGVGHRAPLGDASPP